MYTAVNPLKTPGKPPSFSAIHGPARYNQIAADYKQTVE